MLNLVGATATTFLALVVNSMAADVELSCITPGPDPGGFVVSDLTGTEKAYFYSHDDYDTVMEYPVKTDCRQKFFRGTCDEIKFACEEFETTCPKDKLRFKEANGGGENNVSNRYCGHLNDGSPDFTTSAKHVRVRFTSNDNQQDRGFKCYAQCIRT